jgi:membrane associated rhomboid family serine protease
MNYIIVIVAVTALISIAGFSSDALIDKLILWPAKMENPAEYHRLLSSGFIHADVMHLAFNMISLYFFGASVQFTFSPMGDLSVLSQYAGTIILVLYLSAIIVSSLPSYLRNRKNYSYRSLGASGGVAAMIFFTIFFYPWSELKIVLLPFKMPCIVFGVVYLAAEAYMSRKGGTNINHSAHFWGSVYGLFFALMLDPSHGRNFIESMQHPVWNF